MSVDTSLAEHPVIADVRNFDTRSGTRTERLIFNNRIWVVGICLMLTAFLGWRGATGLEMNASFERMIPLNHPFISNYLRFAGFLSSEGNALRIAVESRDGTIYSREYLDTLRKINDELFLLPGADRAYVKSLWTPSTRWLGVTEDGLDGGPVIPDDYDGSDTGLAQVRQNVERSGLIGQLVAPDMKSSIVLVPLIETDAVTHQRIDYAALSDRLEDLRARYSNDHISLHIVGFAKVVGDLLHGLMAVLTYFGSAVIITTVVLFGYTRCIRSTLLVVCCSLIAVVWLLGMLPLLHYELDPYSVLVPFLVFAIGMSHGAQKMNGIMQDIGRGTHRIVAARYTFRRLFIAGLTALLADAVGFAVLMVIDIDVIRSLAITASVGVGILIFTNLVLLPVLLSYTGVSRSAAVRAVSSEATAENHEKHFFWAMLDYLTRRKWAAPVLLLAAGLGVGGYIVSQNLKVGDLDPGAPELWPESRYNRDNAFITTNYAASSDVYVVMVTTPPMQCNQYRNLEQVDALEWQLRQLPGVVSTMSLAGLSRMSAVAMNEGNPKWLDLPRTQDMLGSIITRAPREMFDVNCDLLTVYVFLKDHKADTLDSVVGIATNFAARNDTAEVRFLSAGGNGGIEAATNIVVRQTNERMLYMVYAAVIGLCLITFRSLRAVICAILPLMLTSILCEALMVWLGIGVKVATLPVIALGVGIGVDYALYILSVTLARLRGGASLSEAYYSALIFTGRVVILTGVTLGVAVATWAFSPIKFQADMGILLAFMFVLNMIGALTLLPALASFLLSLPSALRTTGVEQRS